MYITHQLGLAWLCSTFVYLGEHCTSDARRWYGLQVIEPQVKAYLYTWGEGRNTAEGEHIPVRIESLDIGYIDGQLLLPLIEEHTIDERSPLCGHTYMSLRSVRFASQQCRQQYPCTVCKSANQT